MTWKNLALCLGTGMAFVTGGAAFAQEVPEDKYYAEKVLAEGAGWQLKNISGYAVDGDGRYYSQDIYNIKSTVREAFYQLPLHPYLQEELAAAAVETKDETVFVLDKKIADEIALSYEKGELTEALKAIAEPPDEEVPAGVQTMGPFGSCSDQTFSKSKSFTLNTPISTSQNFGSGFSGTLSATGNINGSATGEVVMKVKRHKIFWVCVPYGVNFQHARAWGNVSVANGSSVNGTLSYNWSWQKEIAKPSLGSLNFFIGPVPVHIGFNLPINLGLDVSASVTGQVNYNGNQTATGAFDYTCTLSGCGGWANYNLGGNSLQPLTGSVSGRVYPTVWVQVAVRAYLYSEWLAYAQVGVRPYLYGDLWGYYGNACGDADGNGINETVSALTFNLDWRLFITAQASAFGGNPTQWNNLWSTQRRNIKFWDLISGGSSAIRPMIGGPASTNVNTSTGYTAKMRPCWPYGDTVNYRFDWGDSTSTNVSGAPQTATAAGKAWSTSGAKTLQLTALSDSWGRQLNATTARSIQVNGSTPTWTGWFNRDAPGGSGDYETLSDLIAGGYSVCSNPVGVECQTAGGAPYTSTGEVYSCSLSGGVCVNSQQPDGICQDYRVRFLCP
ncbi:MAG TPA: hypothetical protein VFZ09_38790 [Archangium sp.]|uniref:hypothetical protein n=1 Tax=Archangium sp. TaxID=1872627 RepID=UPI002E3229C9|nr:hypothetical protein [Archangium sp.]HEX5752225.1 hypothetical protein [Archangium sp.]